MTERVQGPAYYFPSIEKKYGRPISYWLDLIGSSRADQAQGPGRLAQGRPRHRPRARHRPGRPRPGPARRRRHEGAGHRLIGRQDAA